jgi:ABC-type iron transport system FetAB ATPase subunit
MDLLAGQLRGAGEAVAYCSQTPWLQDTSIRDNIIFSSIFDETRYQNVLSACQLLPDLSNFKDADLAILGEKYVSLAVLSREATDQRPVESASPVVNE